MATLSPEQIYAVARQAGFTPDQAVTFTAIALAESGGSTGARNTAGEDSRGLWQINVDPSVRGNRWGDLSDPLTNARAAYEVSNHGRDISPWTVTHDHNRGGPHDYRTYRARAEAASGSENGRGYWDGVSGYGDTTDIGGEQVPYTGASVGGPSHVGDGTPQPALILLGADGEVVGTVGGGPEGGAGAPGGGVGGPEGGVAPGRSGWVLPTTGSLTAPFGQNRGSHRHGGIDLGAAHDTEIYAASGGTVTTVGWDPGGYGGYVRIDHGNGVVTTYAHIERDEIFVSEGDRVQAGELIAYVGSTGRSTGPHLHFEVEANGQKVDPATFLAEQGVSLDGAAGVAGAGTAGAAATSTLAGYDQVDDGLADWQTDSDQDGLTDGFEDFAGTDRADDDSDDDGLSDGYEGNVSHTDPLKADTDDDGELDNIEVVLGTDAGSLPGVAGVEAAGQYRQIAREGLPDEDGDGLHSLHERALGSSDASADTDGDGLLDNLELLYGTGVTTADSDLDGVLDGAEIDAGSNPLEASGIGQGTLPVQPLDLTGGVDPLEAEVS